MDPIYAKKRKIMSVIQCACGCGAKFEGFDNRGRTRKFLPGHNTRIKNPNSGRVIQKGIIVERGNKITYKCDCCGGETTKYLCEHKSYKHHFCSKECRAKWTGSNACKTIEYREKCRKTAIKNGNKPPLIPKEKHWNWKGGISNPNRGQDFEYKKWVQGVLRQANYTCSVCDVRGGRLSAHHIHEWEKYPELRYYPENGLCMCYADHMKWHGLNKEI